MYTAEVGPRGADARQLCRTVSQTRRLKGEAENNSKTPVEKERDGSAGRETYLPSTVVKQSVSLTAAFVSNGKCKYSHRGCQCRHPPQMLLRAW